MKHSEQRFLINFTIGFIGVPTAILIFMSVSKWIIAASNPVAYMVGLIILFVALFTGWIYATIRSDDDDT